MASTTQSTLSSTLGGCLNLSVIVLGLPKHRNEHGIGMVEKQTLDDMVCGCVVGNARLQVELRRAS